MTVTATYRNGAFVPETAVSMREGTRVEVLLPEEAEARTLETIKALKARYPGSIGAITHEEAEELREAIRELREWQGNGR